MGEAIVAGGDPSEVLEPAEHPLDGVAVSVKARRETALPDAIGFRRDVRRGTLSFDFPAYRVRVITLVAMHQIGRGHLIEQGVGGDTVGYLPSGQQERDGAAVLIGQRMDFGGASAARAADRLALLPPFPPDAQRCAFTAEESINSSAGGPPAVASAWNMFDQTLLAAQRRNRL